eukprot:CAMPEP_0184322386 /NCGR_PEP_ID=MMETSP1049-20130417/124218_1 /TAXON_ID=77928 /ORGANISM="Proteomonas sulcata, Strain CCMP704" /LENGTH=616 /DNA_ID=CAMNT_0026643505 /DNA_START=354 /DNA_END=2204 /DNA_ORIENTATION=+
MTCGVADQDGHVCNWGTQCRCTRISCGRFNPPPNMDPVIQDPTREHVYNDQFRVRCKPGNQVNSSAVCDTEFNYTCAADRSFTGPGCIPITCPHYRSRKQLSNFKDMVGVIGGFNSATKYNKTTFAWCSLGTDPVSGPRNKTVRCGEGCILEGMPECTPILCDEYRIVNEDNFLDPEYWDGPPGTASPILDSPGLRYGDEVRLRCDIGYTLTGNQGVEIPGLEYLGLIQVLASVTFPVPNPNDFAEFTLTGEYASISIVIPPGAWPPDLNVGPSITVFSFPETTSRRRLSIVGGRVAGPALNLGPAGTVMARPVTVSLQIFANQDYANFDIQGSRFNSTNNTWILQPYPEFDSQPVDMQARTVKMGLSVFEPPYAAYAVPIVAPTPVPTVAPTNASTPVPEEEDDQPWLLYLAAGLGTVTGLMCCLCVYMFFCVSYSHRQKDADAKGEELLASQSKDLGSNGLSASADDAGAKGKHAKHKHKDGKANKENGAHENGNEDGANEKRNKNGFAPPKLETTGSTLAKQRSLRGEVVFHNPFAEDYKRQEEEKAADLEEDQASVQAPPSIQLGDSQSDVPVKTGPSEAKIETNGEKSGAKQSGGAHSSVNEEPAGNGATV